MAKKKKNQTKRPTQNAQVHRKPSKQNRRAKWVIYLMILAMFLTAFTYGLSAFVK